MASVILRNVCKKYGDVDAVKDLNLECKDKEFVCLLGPSGCGKSSTLRMIAGLEEAAAGEILIDGQTVNSVHPSKRDIAMVFETYALYPNKTVFGNMAYPLKIRKYPVTEINERVSKAAQILDLAKVLKKYPRQLSGGQRQRVAIGRAIVRNPKVFLMDEPISHLDAKLRAHMRGELKHLQRELNETFIYVTHDQLEAMSMADRIAIMNGGVLQQFATPDVIYRSPANMFVASFIGEPPMNFIPCRVEWERGTCYLRHQAFRMAVNGRAAKVLETGNRLGAEVVLGVRPEDIDVSTEKTTSHDIQGKVYITEPWGARVIVDISLGDVRVKVKVGRQIVASVGGPVWLGIHGEKIHLFDKVSTQSLL
jgi:multiple sugar transport system ATP-binding protein